MKKSLVIDIEPDADGVRCGSCNWLDWGPGDHSCNLHGGTDGVNRNALCLAAESRHRRMVEDGNKMLADLRREAGKFWRQKAEAAIDLIGKIYQAAGTFPENGNELLAVQMLRTRAEDAEQEIGRLKALIERLNTSIDSLLAAAADDGDRLAAQRKRMGVVWGEYDELDTKLKEIQDVAEQEIGRLKGLLVQAHDDYVAKTSECNAAESECAEQARLVGMGSEREAKLMAERDEITMVLAERTVERDAAIMGRNCRVRELSQEVERQGRNLINCRESLALMNTKYAELRGERDRLQSRAVDNAAEKELEKCRPVLARLREAKQERDTLRERVREYESDTREIMSSPCAGDEAHCSCVAPLRRRLRELKKERDEARQAFREQADAHYCDTQRGERK